MLKFYCIHEGFYKGVQSRLEHMSRACKELSVEFICHNSLEVDHRFVPKLLKGDMLYNIARGSETLESLLLNKDVATFYRWIPDIVSNQTDTTKYSLLHHKEDLPAPLTIFHATNDRTLLKNYVEFLDGFPVVVKTTGGTMGVGTMICKDYSALFSLTDYLCSINTKFILRQFIEPKEVVRLIVIGDKVVAANQKFIAPGDFRTSIINMPPLPKKYDDEIERLAVKAAHLANSENCGVDIIIGTNNKAYIIEANMPHDFVTTADVSNIDIAKLMLEYLISKSKR